MGYINNIDPKDYFDDDWYEEDEVALSPATGKNRFIGLFPFIIAGCLAGFMTTLSFFAYKDEMINSLISRQASLRQAYEDKIITLRNQLDVVASRQLLDQDAFNARIDHMLDRQKLIESETHLINMIIAETDFAHLARLDDKDIETLKANALNLASRDVVAIAGMKDKPDQMLKSLGQSFGDLTRDRFKALDTIEAHLSHSIANLSSAVEDIGVKPETIMKAHKTSGMGGPFVPIQGARVTNDFETQLAILHDKYQSTRALKYAIKRLPVYTPVSKKRNTISSHFGQRKDPFNGRLSQHNGTDFRGHIGDPIKASASGKVIRAGRAGGYGKLIEIKHDFGFSTRYAHLDKILVKRGDIVKKGDLVGKLGNTGRSTGPHLHFEIRRGKKPVNPMPYLKTGHKIAKFLD